MGRPKQLLPFGGRCLLQHVLDAVAASRLNEIILVLGCQAAAIRAAVRLPTGTPTRVVVNPDYAQGQSSSLRVGLQATNSRCVAAGILLGDQPQITATLIDRVAEAFLAAKTPIARPVYAGGGGLVPGHPVFLAREVWPAVGRVAGDEGARVLMAAHPEWLTDVAVEGDPPADIDTAEDYERVVDTVRAETIRALSETKTGRR
jgi:molybdenum cofactor cytidylyltransferase